MKIPTYNYTTIEGEEAIGKIIIGIDERMQEVKKIIALSKQGLGRNGKPITTGSAYSYRAQAYKELRFYGLMRDLFKGNTRHKLTPLAMRGLNQLIYPAKRSNKEAFKNRFFFKGEQV